MDPRPTADLAALLDGISSGYEPAVDDFGNQYLAASRPAVGELDVERLARAIHEVLPEDGDPEHEDNGEPYCEYLAAAIAGRYDDPEWAALAAAADKPDKP